MRDEIQRSQDKVWLQLRFSDFAKRFLRSLSVCALILPPLASGQPAPLVTPRDLRPELQAPPAATLPLPAPSEIPPQSENLFVSISEVKVSGSYPELESNTFALLSEVKGKRIAVSEFYKLADAVEGLYRNAGYLLVRVLVPPQTVKDGEPLQLTVLDGFIEKLDATTVPARARTQVLATLEPLAGRRRLTNDDLERLLTLAGRGPGLTLRSTLSQGTVAGGVILVLEGKFDSFGGSVSVDNRSSTRLHPWQSTIQIRENQLMGIGEQAYAYVSGGVNPTRAVRSSAPRRVIGGGVIVPLGINGLTFNPEFTWSNTVTAASDFVPVTESQFQRYTLRLSYPLILTRQVELNITGALEASNQRNLAPDFDVTFNQDRLRVLRLGADWSTSVSFNPDARLRVSTIVSKGLRGIGARSIADAEASGIPLSRLGTGPDFLKFEAGAVYDQPLALNVLSHTSLRLQKARKLLPTAELFSLDGEDALSTFRAGSLSDDNGWTLRQEVSRQFAMPATGGALRLIGYGFGAVGRGYTDATNSTQRHSSTSLGVGLRAGWQMVNLSMEYGRRRSHPNNFDGNQLFVKGQVQF